METISSGTKIRTSQAHWELFAHQKVLLVRTIEWLQLASKRSGEATCSAEHVRAVFSILAVACKALRGVACLCEAGLGSEAAAGTRKLFEAYVYLKFIRLSPESHSRLFNLNPAITSVVTHDRLWELRGSRTDELHYNQEPTNQWARGIDQLAAEVSQCSGQSVEGVAGLRQFADYWSDTSLKKMVVRVDENHQAVGIGEPFLMKRFIGEYKPLCEFTHGTGSNVANVLIETKSTLHLDLRASDAFAPQIMIMATKYFIWVCRDVAQSFGGELGNDLWQITEDEELKNRNYAEQYHMTMELE